MKSKMFIGLALGLAAAEGLGAQGLAADRGTGGLETAVLGGGCFWCLEAAYELAPGVISAESGYAGGARENPSYEEVCSGRTGHAEVVRITFDPSKVSYAELLELFWRVHDP